MWQWTAGSFTEPEKHISSAHVHFFHLETKPSSGLDQWRCSLGARPLAMLAPWARSTLTALLARSQLELWSLAMLARWARSTTMHGARSLAMLQPGLDQWIAGRHRPSLADQQFCRSHHRVAPRCWLPRLPPRAPQMTPLGSMALQGWQVTPRRCVSPREPQMTLLDIVSLQDWQVAPRWCLSRIKFTSWCRKLGVSVRLFMQLEIDSVLPALRALFGLIWIFLTSSLWGVFILIFTLDFEILSTRRNDVWD